MKNCSEILGSRRIFWCRSHRQMYLQTFLKMQCQIFKNLMLRGGYDSDSQNSNAARFSKSRNLGNMSYLTSNDLWGCFDNVGKFWWNRWKFYLSCGGCCGGLGGCTDLWMTFLNSASKTSRGLLRVFLLLKEFLKICRSEVKVHLGRGGRISGLGGQTDLWMMFLNSAWKTRGGVLSVFCL